MNVTYGRFAGTLVIVIGLGLLIGLIWAYIIVGDAVRLVRP